MAQKLVVAQLRTIPRRNISIIYTADGQVCSFMVGNTYPYSQEDWVQDISLAASRGLDGFALNIGREDWQFRSVALAYAAAQELATSFKLFLSFDMTVLRGSSEDDVQLLRRYMAAYSHHRYQLWYRNKVLVSTFAGQDCRFGRATPQEAWALVKDALHEIAPVHFVPSFFINPERYPEIPVMDGYFNWNGSWPIHLNVNSPREDVEYARLDTDRHHIHHLGGRTFMAAVSPWFFTHYGSDSWNKNWIYRGDDWLFVRRWEQLIAMRDCVDIVQIISWNDYGESHYIGPIRGTQPNSQAWVDGFPHDGWLDLNHVFARMFKEGTYPAIERDRIFMWSRPHLKAAEASEDNVPRPDRWQLTDDKFWVVALATADAYIRVSISKDHPAQTWNIRKGVSKLSHPMVVGEGMTAEMVRDGTVVAECSPARDVFHVQEQPKTYNFNVYVAASER